MKKDIIILVAVLLLIIAPILYLCSYWGIVNDTSSNEKWIAKKALSYMKKKYNDNFTVTSYNFDRNTNGYGEASIRVFLTPENNAARDLKGVYYTYNYNIFLGRLLYSKERDNYDETFLNYKINPDFKNVLVKHFKDTGFEVDSQVREDSNFMTKASTPEEYKTLKKIHAQALKPKDYTNFKEFYEKYGLNYTGRIYVNIYNMRLSRHNIKQFCRKMDSVRKELDYFSILNNKKCYYASNEINGQNIQKFEQYYSIDINVYGDMPEKEYKESGIDQNFFRSGYTSVEFSSNDFHDPLSLENYIVTKYPEIMKSIKNIN